FKTMCSLGFTKSLGFALIPLAICCIVANVLLFFPDGAVEYLKTNHLSWYVWSFMGIGGGGIAVSCSNQIETMIIVTLCAYFVSLVSLCILFVQMCGSVLVSLIGLAGSGYCFAISASAMLQGPYCQVKFGNWTNPFQDNATYLLHPDSWSQCEKPANIVEWNVTLLAILLGLSLIEFLVCFVQFISGLVSAICRPCCYKQQYSLSA
ncbi:transmembrane 4 L six family member 18, partial [Silurus asotus]